MNVYEDNDNNSQGKQCDTGIIDFGSLLQPCQVNEDHKGEHWSELTVFLQTYMAGLLFLVFGAFWGVGSKSDFVGLLLRTSLGRFTSQMTVWIFLGC